MTIKYPKKIRTHIYALLCFLTPLSFAAPVVNVEDQDMLHDAQLQHEYYFKGHNVVSYMLSFADSESYQIAQQYQKLLDARAVVEEPQYKVDGTFLTAFKELKISSSEQLESLLTAFTSPIYKASPHQQLLVSLYHSVVYGSFVQSTMHNNMDWEFEKSCTLWFLANFPFYPVFKPHLKEFLKSTYANGASPTLYNQGSHVTSAALSTENEDYLEDLGKEIGFFLLWMLSCNNNGEELRNEISFMESCKLSKHSAYKDLKGLKHDGSYLLESSATAGPSKIRLTPVPGYYRDFSDQEARPEEYSKKSLRHVMRKVVQDKTEGAMFFVLYQGADKYQFFTVGVYQGCLALSYMVDDHPPTPHLSFLTPTKGMNLDLLIDGIHAQLHQSKSHHDMVPDLQGVWMMSSE